MSVVHLPPYFSIRSADDAIRSCSAIISSNNLIDVDANKLVFVDPFGMALLAATLHMVSEQAGEVRVHNPDSQLSSYLQRMDVFHNVELVDHAPTQTQRNERADVLVEVKSLDRPADVDQHV